MQPTGQSIAADLNDAAETDCIGAMDSVIDKTHFMLHGRKPDGFMFAADQRCSEFGTEPVERSAIANGAVSADAGLREWIR